MNCNILHNALYYVMRYPISGCMTSFQLKITHKQSILSRHRAKYIEKCLSKVLVYLNTMQVLLIVFKYKYTFKGKLQLNYSYHLVFDCACTCSFYKHKLCMISGVFKE